MRFNASLIAVAKRRRKTMRLVRRKEKTMKRLVEEVSGEGLEKLIGERVTFFCLNYIYTGKLIGVNTTCVLLKDPSIVYETGSFDSKEWKDAQKLPNEFYLQTAAIEGFGIVK